MLGRDGYAGGAEPWEESRCPAIRVGIRWSLEGEPKKSVCGWDSATLQAEGPAGSSELLGPALSSLWGCPARLRSCSFARYLKPARSVAWDKEGALPLGMVWDGKVS